MEHLPIIAFDGNHRSGKGTQIKFLETTLIESGFHPYRLRGDGSRPGTGEYDGDPYSEWWQNFKTYVKGFENEYDAWRIGARKLLAEAAIKRTSLALDKNAVMLFDRSYLSRAQMTIKEGLALNFENMYRNVDNDYLNDSQIHLIKPDLTIYLDASPHVLAKRLTLDDPKFQFRQHNIIHSSDYFEEAFIKLNDNGENIVRVDANQAPESVEKCIRNVILTQNIFNRKGLK